MEAMVSADPGFAGVVVVHVAVTPGTSAYPQIEEELKVEVSLGQHVHEQVEVCNVLVAVPLSAGVHMAVRALADAKAVGEDMVEVV